MTKVVLLKSWWLNVGDGFVKIGAEHILNNVFGHENVQTCSAVGANKFDMIGDGAAEHNFPSLMDVIQNEIEVVALAGCVLNEKLIRLVEKIESLPKKPKVLLLGAGGYRYEKREVASVRNILERLRPFALIARDSESLEHYGDLFDYAERGLDCAYWVADAIPAVQSERSFTVRTFNRMVDPGRSGGVVMRCEHLPLRLSIEPRSRSIIRNLYRVLRPGVRRQDIEAFYSDNVAEYLALYSAANEVHTDMVHATVASLSYGTPVQMYYRSGRQGVLTSVVGEEVFNRPFVCDPQYLSKLKGGEISTLKAMFRK
ncbi:polysaccharide pyruvyl transferase family protein [Qipengyuania flava]|nr:polysaccharide pyruvyl transferase family protein [Qipengyuania flava]